MLTIIMGMTMMIVNLPLRIDSQKQKLKAEPNDDMSCDFKLGSTAEVGRTFSFAKYNFPDTRFRVTHQLFEDICFLKQISKAGCEGSSRGS